MIIPHSFKGQKVAVLGLGKSGQTAALALEKAGATVMAWDDTADVRRALPEHLVKDLGTVDWEAGNIDFLVQSPGIPHTFPQPHPVSAKAKVADVPIICDVELLARTHPDCTTIAITGTNGKSTTTALVGHILTAAGKDLRLGGNFGIPVMGFEPPSKDTLIVLEVSSYQCELVPSLSADIAAILNFSPDHLDRHGGMEGYVAAKKRLFDQQKAGAISVIGQDDDDTRAMSDHLRTEASKTILQISGKDMLASGTYALDGILYDALDGPPVELLDLTEIVTLPGDHNHQNAASAYAICRAAGVSRDDIIRGLKSFPGLAHRQERLGSAGEVVFVNDSKATNADATARALTSYNDIYWIAGGVPKDGGIDELLHLLNPVREVFLIGEAAPAFAATLDHRLTAHLSHDLDTATRAAYAAARDAGGGVVLLSPACASFDQFKSFEARGDTFRTIVASITGEAA